MSTSISPTRRSPGRSAEDRAPAWATPRPEGRPAGLVGAARQIPGSAGHVVPVPLAETVHDFALLHEYDPVQNRHGSEGDQPGTRMWLAKAAHPRVPSATSTRDPESNQEEEKARDREEGHLLNRIRGWLPQFLDSSRNRP